MFGFGFLWFDCFVLIGWYVLVVVALIWLVCWMNFCDVGCVWSGNLGLRFCGVFGLAVVWVGGLVVGLVFVNSVVNYISCCVMILFCFVIVLRLLWLDCFSAWFTFNCVWVGLFCMGFLLGCLCCGFAVMFRVLVV